MAINVGDILASFRVIDDATQPLEDIAGAQAEVAATLTRLSQAYASASGPVEGWNKLAEEFTGMPLAERANDMASAVEAIGGASRLTEQEQTRVNAVMEEALRKYEALGIEAPPAIRELAEATRQVGTETAGAEAGVSRFVGMLKGAAVAATAAIAAITAVGAAVLKIGEYGAGVGDIAEQFGKLAQKAGVDATQALQALREATAGTVSDLDLMTATLPLLSSGFKGSAEDLRTMADAARVLSERGMGLNEAMGLVSSAMTTGRTRSLSMQGVVIDMAGAMKDLRDATQEEGSAVETSASLHVKQQEILKGLKGLVQANGEVMLDFADRTDQVRVTFANFYNEFAKRLSESEALSTVFDRISTALSDAFGAEKAMLMDNLLVAFDKIVLFIGDVLVVAVEEGLKVFRWLQDVVEGASSSGAWSALVSVFTAIWKILGLVWDVVAAVGKALLWLGDTQGVFAGITAGFESMSTAIGWVSKAVSWAVDQVTLLISVLNDLRGVDPGLPKVTGGFDDLHKRGFQPIISASDALMGKLGPLTQGLGAVGGAANGTTEQLKAMQAAEDAMSGQAQIAATQALIATYDRLAKQGITPTIAAQQALHKAVEATITIHADAGRAIPADLARVEAATRAVLTATQAWHRVASLPIARPEMPQFSGLYEGDLPSFDLGVNPFATLPASVTRTMDEIGVIVEDANGNLDTLMATGGAQAGASWGEGVTAIAKNFGNLMADAIINGNWRNAFGALGSQIGSFLGGKLGASLGTSVGGLLGETLGALLPGIGALVGPLVDKAFGWVTKAAGKAANDTRDAFITQAGGLHALNVAAHAAGLSLDALLAAKNPKQVQAAIDALSAALAKAKQATDALITGLQTLGSAGGLLTAGMVAQLKKDQNNPEVQAAFKAFLTTNLSKAASGLGALTTGLQAGATALAQAAAIKVSVAAGMTEDAAQKAASGIVGIFVKTQAQATGLGAAIAGTFAAMVQNGASFKDALAAIQPSLDALQKQLTASGLQGGAAFAYLGAMSAIANDAITGPLLDGISGAKAALEGLHNAGVLNQEMFAGLTTSAIDAYNAIIAQGVDGQAALQLMQPTLQTIWELQQKFGYETDAATQALIDQAIEAGTVGAAHMSAADQTAAAMTRVVTVLEAMARAMGVTLPAAAAVGAKKISEEFAKVDATIHEPWADWGAPPEVVIPYRFDPQNELPSGAGADGYAAGGVVHAAGGWPAPVGTDTVPAMLTPGERVLTVAQNRDYERASQAVAAAMAVALPTVTVPIAWDVPPVPVLPALAQTLAPIAWQVPPVPDLPALAQTIAPLAWEIPPVPDLPDVPRLDIPVDWHLAALRLPDPSPLVVPVDWQVPDLPTVAVPDVPTVTIPVAWDIPPLPPMERPALDTADVGRAWDALLQAQQAALAALGKDLDIPAPWDTWTPPDLPDVQVPPVPAPWDEWEPPDISGESFPDPMVMAAPWADWPMPEMPEIRIPAIPAPWQDWTMPDLPSIEEAAAPRLDFGAGMTLPSPGRERAMPAGDRGGEAPVTITVVSQLDGREVARNQVKFLPQQLTRAGL